MKDLVNFILGLGLFMYALIIIIDPIWFEIPEKYDNYLIIGKKDKNIFFNNIMYIIDPSEFNDGKIKMINQKKKGDISEESFHIIQVYDIVYEKYEVGDTLKLK